MEPTDRDQFLVQFGNLCGAYNVLPSQDRIDGFWRGLSKMPLSSFVRCVEFCLGETGPEKFPTFRDIWAVHRQTRSVRVDARTGDEKAKGRGGPTDAVEALGSLAMLRFVCDMQRKTQPSEACVERAIAAKNKLVATYRTLRTEEDIPDAEILEAMAKKFAEIYEPMSAEELQRNRDRYRDARRAFAGMPAQHQVAA